MRPLPAPRHDGVEFDPSVVVVLPQAQGFRALRPAETGEEPGGAGVCDRLVWSLAPGTLSESDWLCFDQLAEGPAQPVFLLRCRDAQGRSAVVIWSVLCRVQARVAIPIACVRQQAWQLGRRGAWLKPSCYGVAVEPAEIVELELVLQRSDGGAVRWQQTQPVIATADPGLPNPPILSGGALVDELGQSCQHQWAGRSQDHHEVTARLRAQRAEAAAGVAHWPSAWSRYGGDATRRIAEPTGFFATAQADGRWYLVDPDGHPFWSSGMDCVRPTIPGVIEGLPPTACGLPEPGSALAERMLTTSMRGQPSVDHLAGNLFRAFGEETTAAWTELVGHWLRRWGFNSIGNWSDPVAARAAAVPYVIPLRSAWTTTPKVFRDFPDVFDPAFLVDCATIAEQLRPLVNDPLLIGYFLMNEPTWGFAAECPAAGAVRQAPSGPWRQALVAWLLERHGSSEAVAAIWGLTPDAIAAGPCAFAAAAMPDLEAFSGVMAGRLFGELHRACKAVDPHHLDLGARYYTIPPAWALPAMDCFDVFSINCYRRCVPDEFSVIAEQTGRPLLIGEWHFGALDVGLPGSGIGRVDHQADRGRAFRAYVETAASKPWCVGVHYFTLYDEHALGRFDGENWNIGFLDICHRPYEALGEAARCSHERLYGVVTGALPPTGDRPAYRTPLFM